MSTFKEVLRCILLLVLISGGVEVILFVHDLRSSIRPTIAVLESLPKQTDQLRNDVTSELKALRQDSFKQIDLLRKDSVNQVNLLRQDVLTIAERTEHDTIELLNTRTAVMQDSLNALTQVVSPLSGTLKRVDRIVARVGETSDLLLDCENNPNCIANRSIGTLQAVEKFAQAGQKSMETVNKAVPIVTENVEQATAASAQASRNTAAMMANLEAQSKPLPMMLRFAPQAVQAILIGIGLLK